MFALLIALAVPPEAHCPSTYEARALKIARPVAASTFLPEKTDMPDTTVRLVCRVGGEGALTACTVRRENPAGWGFGAWARAEASRWRVLTREVRGCPVLGRSVGFTVRSGRP